MNLLLYGPVNPAADAPDFGEEFRIHMESKRHPQAAAASKTAWNLLAKGLCMVGCSPLPKVAFSKTGKPCFTDSPLHFSISHSGTMAAALISENPCGVDIERIRKDVSPRLAERCLNDEERRLGCGFFEIWTKKECIAKIDGSGMRSKPKDMDTLSGQYADGFACLRIQDAQGGEYALACLCADPKNLQVVAIKE